MDVQTAIRIFDMLNTRAYLNEEEQKLFDDAEVTIEDNGLFDEN